MGQYLPPSSPYLPLSQFVFLRFFPFIVSSCGVALLLLIVLFIRVCFVVMFLFVFSCFVLIYCRYCIFLLLFSLVILKPVVLLLFYLFLVIFHTVMPCYSVLNAVFLYFTKMNMTFFSCFTFTNIRTHFSHESFSSVFSALFSHPPWASRFSSLVASCTPSPHLSKHTPFIKSLHVFITLPVSCSLFCSSKSTNAYRNNNSPPLPLSLFLSQTKY